MHQTGDSSGYDSDGTFAPSDSLSVGSPVIQQEMFVQYLAEQGVKALVAEKKPRKTMQYKDVGMSSFPLRFYGYMLTEFVASAVARIDNLEFLSDVIPQRLAVKEPRETKPAKSRVKGGAVDKRQTTLTAGLTKPASAADKDAVDGVQVNGESSREASADPLEDSGSKKRDAAPSNGSPKSQGTESKTAADNSDPDVEMT